MPVSVRVVSCVLSLTLSVLSTVAACGGDAGRATDDPVDAFESDVTDTSDDTAIDTADTTDMADDGTPDTTSDVPADTDVVDTDVVSSCPDDPLEPNDDEASAKAWLPEHGSQQYSLCPGEVDVFALNLAAGDAVRFEVSLAPGLSIPYHWSFSRAGQEIEGGQLQPSIESNVVEIAVSVTVAGTYYFTLRRPPCSEPDAETCSVIAEGDFYGLSVTIVQPASCDVPDAFEPNNERATMPTIEPGTYPDLVVCGGANPDWDGWRFELEPGDTAIGTIDAECIFDCPEVTIFDPLTNGVIVGTGWQVSVTASVAQTYYLGVDARPRSAGVRYTLTFAIVEGEGPLTCDDQVEDDTIGAATPLSEPAVYLDDTVCEGDDDYFAITASRDDLISARATTMLKFGEPTLMLLAPDGTTVLDDSTEQRQEFDLVRATATADGVYYLRVLLEPGGETTAYSLIVEVDGTIACSTDPHEPNDDPATDALVVLGNGTTEGLACLGEIDWFRVEVPDPVMVFGLMESHSNGGGVEVDFFDDTFTPLPRYGTGYRAVRAGSYYVAVRAWDGNVSYSLETSLTPAEICLDAFEPNDTVDTRKVVTEGVWSDLGLCITDGVDHYALTLTAGQRAGVRVDFTTDEQIVDLFILPDGAHDISARIAESRTLNRWQAVLFDAPTDGTYTILVRAFATSHGEPLFLAPYTMTIDVQ